MPRSILTIVSLTFSFFAPMASAHHGFSAHFDPDNIIRIEGRVKQFDFINPHGRLYIDSVNAAGEPVVYACDLQARTQLVRRGVDDSLFTVGEPIVVEGFQARRDPLGCEFGVGYFADGSSFTMRSTDEARTQFAMNQRIPMEADAARTIFGTWIRPGMIGDASGRGPRTGLDSITEEGKAAAEAFDPITENPAIHCQGGSPLLNWGRPGLATSIRQEDEKIILYHESMDVLRTVHMDLTEHPAGVQPSDMGHSIGRFEEEVLIIDTTAFAAGVLIGSILHSDQMTFQERLSIKEDTGDLLISWVANDPVYYSEPITGSQSLQSTTQEIIPYNCIPGSSMSDISSY